VNTSNLTKYIPGKVWSYALQMFWLSKAGYAKSHILYVNLITLYISLSTALILGLAYLVLSPTLFPPTITAPLLGVSVAFEISFILFNTGIINWLLKRVNALFKRDIKYFKTSIPLLVYLHAVYFLAASSFGAGAYLLTLGIGFDIASPRVLSVMSSFMISEVAGFVSFVTPGGLGVREGVMYLLLKNNSSGPISLILPIAARIMSMLVDAAFGATALSILKRYSKPGSLGELRRDKMSS
jgi:uncharacterized membrane protein YbhN (UPF0104 family)